MTRRDEGAAKSVSFRQSAGVCMDGCKGGSVAGCGGGRGQESRMRRLKTFVRVGAPIQQ